jgi:hypothetical protein
VNTHLTLDLCDIGGGPSLVRSHGDDTGSIDTTLQQRLGIGKDGAKVVAGGLARGSECERVGELESRVGRDDLGDVGSRSVKRPVGQVDLCHECVAGEKGGKGQG